MGRLAQGWAGRVVVDLRDVSFLDCSTIGCFVGLRSRFVRAGGALTLRNPAPNVRRTLEVAQVLHLLGVA